MPQTFVISLKKLAEKVMQVRYERTKEDVNLLLQLQGDSLSLKDLVLKKRPDFGINIIVAEGKENQKNDGADQSSNS